MIATYENQSSIGSRLRLTLSDAFNRQLPAELRTYLLNLDTRTADEVSSFKLDVVAEILKYRAALTRGKNTESITPDIVKIWVDAAVINGKSAPLRGVGDVVEKTLTSIGITKERYARLTGKKGCGKCSQRQADINRRFPFQQQAAGKDPLQFLYCYFHGAAKQDELRWSMRSIDTHYEGDASFLIVGDKPPWYDGPFIHHPRVKRASGFRRGLRDVLWKMNTVQHHPLVEDEFFWMMDDTFLLRPISKKELIKPRAFGKIKQSQYNSWKTVCRETGNMLGELGFPVRDYATHLGHHIVKSNLQRLFKVFDPVEQTFLWEVAYGNMFHTDPESATPYLRRFKNEATSGVYYSIAKKATFLNTYHAAWCQSLRNWLFRKFPEPHLGESGDRPVMNRVVQDSTIAAHYLLVQSAYQDPKMSEYRLSITKDVCAPSIAAQHERVKLVVSVCEADPFLEERKELFRDCRPDVQFIYRDPALMPVSRDNFSTGNKWPLPNDTRILVTRLDDDDALSSDYCELTYEAAGEIEYQKFVLRWPNGYVRVDDGKLRRMRYPANHFCSFVTDDATAPCDLAHMASMSLYPIITVNTSRGWLWNRHGETLADTEATHIGKVADPANSSRWAITMNGDEVK